jgi:hypothetical protein
VSEQQPMQVQDQAGVQWAPVFPEQVVLGVAVACQLLLAAVAQRRRLPVDDPLGAVGVCDDDALDRRRGGDAQDTGPVGELGEQPRHLITVERLRAPAEVDRAEPGDYLRGHHPDERVKVCEAAQGTSQPT